MVRPPSRTVIAFRLSMMAAPLAGVCAVVSGYLVFVALDGQRQYKRGHLDRMSPFIFLPGFRHVIDTGFPVVRGIRFRFRLFPSRNRKIHRNLSPVEGIGDGNIDLWLGSPEASLRAPSVEFFSHRLVPVHDIANVS